MAENVFGVDARPGSEDDPYTWLSEDQPTEPVADEAAEGTPAEVAAPEAGTTESTPDQIQPTEEDLAALAAAEAAAPVEGTEEAPQEGETVQEAVERLYANKYRTVDDLEKGYRERSDMWRRAVENAKAEQAAAIAERQQREQYEAAMRQVIPTLEQAAAREQQFRAFAEQYRQETGQYPPGLAPTAPVQGSPGVVGPQDVQRMLEERLAVERQNMAAQFQQAQEAQALSDTIMGFYQDHPEVEVRGALDNEITDAMTALNTSPAWEALGYTVDASDRETVELVYEMATRPALLEVLKLRPEYFTSETGLQLARRDASLIEGVPPTTEPRTAAVPASRAGASAGQKIPFAESASGAAPQETGPDMNDPWQRVLAASDSTTSRDGRKSIFFE